MTETQSTHPDRRVRVSAFIQRLLLAALDLYIAFVLLYLILHTFTADRLWPVAFLQNFTPWLLLPSLLCTLLLLWLRHTRRAGVAALPALGFLVLYGGLFLPRIAAQPSCDPSPDNCLTLRVMAYNVGEAPSENLTAVLARSDADLIALSELGPEQATALTETLAEQYPYQRHHPLGIPGKGLLSRFPIVNDTLFYLQAERLPYLRLELAIDGATLTVIVAHPPPPGLSQGRYTIHPDAPAEILTIGEMAIDHAPTLLLGDFNMVDQSNRYQSLVDLGLKDAHRKAGWGLGLTFPVNRFRAANSEPLDLPLVRLDYIFTTDHFWVEAAWVGEDAGSDHLPVLSDLIWDRSK